MAVRSYGPDTNFGYVSTVTLTLEVWLWVKVMTHPGIMDNNCVKYYLDPIWQWRVMALTPIFWYICTVTLTFWGMTLDQGHDTPLGYGQQLCEILFNMAVRSNGPDTDFVYVCTVTLTLEMWPLVKVMTYPWVMDSEILSRSDKRIRSDGLDTMWTDRRTGKQGESSIPPTIVCGAGDRNFNEWFQLYCSMLSKMILSNKFSKKYFCKKKKQKQSPNRAHVSFKFMGQICICLFIPPCKQSPCPSVHIVSVPQLLTPLSDLSSNSHNCVHDTRVCHDIELRSYIQGQDRSAHILKIRVWAITPHCHVGSR